MVTEGCPKRSTIQLQRSSIWNYIEEEQRKYNGCAFGRVLDAGTGLHSLRWISSLLVTSNTDSSSTLTTTTGGISSFIGITADQVMKRSVEKEAIKLGVPTVGNNNQNGKSSTIKNEFLIGNWFVDKEKKKKHNDDTSTTNDVVDLTTYLLKGEGRRGELFDTIVADYLIGAMDAFSPFQQDLMIETLTTLLKPGGRLYIIGMEPIPDLLVHDAVNNGKETREQDGNIFCKVTRIRDAIVKLATDAKNSQQRPYREYPMGWVQRMISQEKRLTEITVTKLYLKYRHQNIVNQINVGRGKLKYIPTNKNSHTTTNSTRNAMELLLNELEIESKEITDQARGQMVSVGNGFDYIIVAERLSQYQEWKLNLIDDKHSDALFFLLILNVGLLVYFVSQQLKNYHNSSRRRDNNEKGAANHKKNRNKKKKS
mmetsp:Transcript_43705/g.49288  ORF Transcript_43705/g.49288 Transcript_43705/m.49288 type:complete len:426 (-) Transcript_43705:63-1340(-)